MNNDVPDKVILTTPPKELSSESQQKYSNGRRIGFNVQAVDCSDIEHLRSIGPSMTGVF